MFLVQRVQLLACTLSVAVALDAHAQAGSVPLLVDHLDIWLNPQSACGGITKVLVVMGDDEIDTRKAQKAGDDDCHWSTEPRLGIKYDTALSAFSLRLDGVKKRTTCKEAKPKNGVGLLEFKIAQEESWELYVRTDPKIPLSYLRDLKANPKLDPGSVDCLEGGVIDPRFPISKLWWLPWKWEALRLQLNKEHQDPNYPGLVVNHQAVSKYLKDGATLGILEIVDALGVEGSDGTLRSLRGFSSNGYTADNAHLLGFEPVTECMKPKPPPKNCLSLTLVKSK